MFRFRKQNAPYDFKILTCEEHDRLKAAQRQLTNGPRERSHQYLTLSLGKTPKCPKDANEAYIMWKTHTEEGLPGNNLSLIHI